MGKTTVVKKANENIRPEIIELCAAGPVTWEVYKCIRCNSYEQEYIYPHLTDAALCRLVTDIMLPNCRRPDRPGPAITYDEGIVNVFVPLLIARLRAAKRPDVVCVYAEDGGLETVRLGDHAIVRGGRPWAKFADDVLDTIMRVGRHE